jgi:hypothetical protein
MSRHFQVESKTETTFVSSLKAKGWDLSLPPKPRSNLIIASPSFESIFNDEDDQISLSVSEMNPDHWGACSFYILEVIVVCAESQVRDVVGTNVRY